MPNQINLICPFCVKEVKEDEHVFLANEDNIDTLDLEDTPKVFVHVDCYKEKKC